MELSLCPRVPQRWESPPPGQSRRSSLATLPLLWGMEGAIEQRELCVISWRLSDHEPLMSSLCAQISFRESQSRSWRETIEMFQHPIYPTAVALDPFFFFFSLATVSQPEPNQSQPGCPAGGIDELCRSGPASTVPFSPALTRSFVSLSFADPSVFFSRDIIIRLGLRLANPSPTSNHCRPPKSPQGSQRPHPFSGLPSHPEPLRRRAASFCTSSAGARFSLQSQTRPRSQNPSSMSPEQ